jgi:hypothetical protein
MEATVYSETSATTYQTIRRHIPECSISGLTLLLTQIYSLRKAITLPPLVLCELELKSNCTANNSLTT